jgi:hypothetical protein
MVFFHDTFYNIVQAIKYFLNKRASQKWIYCKQFIVTYLLKILSIETYDNHNKWNIAPLAINIYRL